MAKQRRPNARKPESAPLAPPPPPPRWRGWLVRWGPIPALLSILGVAFALRYIPSRALVFPRPGEVRLYDTDPYYHLRHSRYAAAHFPHLQRSDPAIYPNGQPGWYVGLFDLTIAGTALVLGGGHPSEDTLERVAAWTPAVLGTLAFSAMFWLGWVLAGAGGGLLAALLLLIDPGTFIHRSLVGSVDHHVCEVVLGLLTLAGVARCLQVTAAEPRPAWWRPAVAHALPLSLFLFTWLGAPIYIVLVGVGLFVAATAAIASGGGEAIGRAALRYSLGLYAVLVPAALVAPWLIMERGFFVQALLAIGLLAVGLPLYVWVARLAIARGAAPWLAALGGVVLAIVAAVVVVRVIPGGRHLMRALIGIKSDLVKEQGDVTVASFWRLSGVPGLLGFAAPLVFVVDALRGKDRRGRLAPAVTAALVGALWVRTHDYGYAAGPMLCFLAAMLIVRGLEALRRFAYRLAAAVAVGAALLAPWAAGATQAPLLPPAAVQGLMLITDGWVAALRWMKAHTPPLALPLDATIPTDRPFHHPKGNYGVLAFWDWGHYIAAIGERPPLASGGISGSIAKWYFLSDEEQALRALGERMGPDDQVRYVIADARTEGDFVLAALQMAGLQRADYIKSGFTEGTLLGRTIGLWAYNERFHHSMGARLYEEDGDGLGHFRLVYACRERTALAYIARPDGKGGARISRHASVITDAGQDQAWHQVARATAPIETANGLIYAGIIEPSVKLFEVVPGAHLAGTAPPGSNVEARLELHAVEGGYKFRYHRIASVDASGHYDLIVPYATGPDERSDVLANGPYQVLVDGSAPKQAVVAAAQVEQGATVAVP